MLTSPGRRPWPQGNTENLRLESSQAGEGHIPPLGGPRVKPEETTPFPVVMYGCDSWTVKKAERRKMMLLNCGVGEDS